MPAGVKRNRFHPDDRVRATLSTCGRGACTYLQQIPAWRLATEAEGNPLVGNFSEALQPYREAIATKPDPWQLESIYMQAIETVALGLKRDLETTYTHSLSARACL